MSQYQHWLIVEDSHVATLTLHRPQANNSLTPETLSELRLITADLSARDEIWAVIVEGSGDHFSAGVDTSVIQGIPDQPEAAFKDQFAKCSWRWTNSKLIPKPTIARLKGFCIGGGLLLALCCDFRIASQRTIFALPEVKLGIAVIMGTQRISRVVGIGRCQRTDIAGRSFQRSNCSGVGSGPQSRTSRST